MNPTPDKLTTHQKYMLRNNSNPKQTPTEVYKFLIDDLNQDEKKILNDFVLKVMKDKSTCHYTEKKFYGTHFFWGKGEKYTAIFDKDLDEFQSKCRVYARIYLINEGILKNKVQKFVCN